MKVYIAGPMSGITNLNRDNFNRVAKYFSDQKVAVLNPAMLPNGLSQQEYMSICLPMVMCADTLFMLDGWQHSQGALAEHALAIKLNKEIIYETDSITHL